MSKETKNLIEELVSYYSHHSMTEFMASENTRLKYFVTDDFTGLSKQLESEIA